MIDDLITDIKQQLETERYSTGCLWRGRLSSSAISTSVAIFALYLVDKEKYASHIGRGVEWLKATARADGSWGDSPESPSNMTATLLAYAALYAIDTPPSYTNTYLTEKLGGVSDIQIANGVLAYYGRDLTFSTPILTMCALAGIISCWDKIPQLPFEVSVLPQGIFRFFRLPVVSYAIPALIAVGILRYKKGQKSIFSPIRALFIKKSLQVLNKLQPSHGGFLEAAPLTAFVAICMSGADYRRNVVTQRCVDFLVNTVRDDGSWAIDTDLSCWVTSLAVKALDKDIKDRTTLAATIRRNAFTYTHPFTGARAGGWGWTDLRGSVPDADDTAGALVALNMLLDGVYCSEAEKGVEWLLSLQNSDGGMPTFCKGWGKLPFDRSSPDISAHALLALHLWMNTLPARLQKKCRKATARLLKWMLRAQAADGSWTPLWFGDQDAIDERAPVYGTAVTIEYLSGLNVQHSTLRIQIIKGLDYLLSTQNTDGGWGGAKDVPSKVTFTARATSALTSVLQNYALYNDALEAANDNNTFIDKRRTAITTAIKKSCEYIYRKHATNELYRPEPIGLYFARLWYSEKMYNLTFVLNMLNRIKYTPNKSLSQ